MTVYVASPLGFSEAGRAFYYQALIPLLNSLAFEVLDPWALTPAAKIKAVLSMRPGPDRIRTWRMLNAKIARQNVSAIDASDLLLAILDGPDVDSGTASEIGYAFAKGKQLVGYRGDERRSAENEGCTVNLQVQYFVEATGGQIATNLSQLRDTLARVKLAAQPKKRTIRCVNKIGRAIASQRNPTLKSTRKSAC